MSTDSARQSASDDAYDRLVAKYRRISHLQSAGGVLSWDQQVMMPEGGTPARSKQLSALSAVSHELLTESETADLVEEVREQELDDEQAAVFREIERDYERAAAVPTDLVQRISEASSEALPKWEQAKAEDDFEQFAPALQRHVDLQREYADEVDPDRDPYAVLFENYEPCLPLERAEAILESLKETLVPMIGEIRESDADVTTDALSRNAPYDADAQEGLSRDALDAIGYDWDRGRLDVSSHPFTSGNQFDCRVTTRYDEDDPIGGLMATIHEFGHAQYNLGLPQDEFGTPLGESRDLSVHESQSRLWENHVGRSQAFWDLFLPAFKEQFEKAGDVSAREAYESANQVYEDNLIRVQADELTYHLHIVIRFEIERALISGDLDVEDVPETWNDKYEQYLGIRPETDAKGCLQDIHWSHGSFGYFPTYSLGSVMAAQLWDAFEADYDGDPYEAVGEGDFSALRQWLSENVHDHGARYETNELVVEATGEDFAADAFLEYVTEKYGALYDLDAA